MQKTARRPLAFEGIRRRRRALFTTASALLAICACAADGAESSAAPEGTGAVLHNEAEMNLVAELDLGPDRRIKYFEPEPGSVMEVELGRVDPDRAPEPEDSIAARYERLSGRRAPDRLMRALQRVAEGRSRTALTASVARLDAPEPGASHSVEGTPAAPPRASLDKDLIYPKKAASEAWFLNAYCTATDRFWGTGKDEEPWEGFSSFLRECEYFKTGIYTHEGAVTGSVYCSHTALGPNGDWANATVETGWYLGVRCDSVTNKVHRSLVENSAGDSYRHCVNWHY